MLNNEQIATKRYMTGEWRQQISAVLRSYRYFSQG